MAIPASASVSLGIRFGLTWVSVLQISNNDRKTILKNSGLWKAFIIWKIKAQGIISAARKMSKKYILRLEVQEWQEFVAVGHTHPIDSSLSVTVIRLTLVSSRIQKTRKRVEKRIQILKTWNDFLPFFSFFLFSVRGWWWLGGPWINDQTSISSKTKPQS